MATHKHQLHSWFRGITAEMEQHTNQDHNSDVAYIHSLNVRPPEAITVSFLRRALNSYLFSRSPAWQTGTQRPPLSSYPQKELLCLRQTSSHFPQVSSFSVSSCMSSTYGQQATGQANRQREAGRGVEKIDENEEITPYIACIARA